MPHHKSGCTGAIQPSCHHQRLLDQQGASMYGPLPIRELDAVDPTMVQFEFLPPAHTERLGPGRYPDTRRVTQPGGLDD
jgi:hypothetical protein